MSPHYSCYLRNLLSPQHRRILVERTINFLTKNELLDTHIACRGTSGIGMAFAIASHTNQEVIIVRKDSDSFHADTRVETFTQPKRVIILDDLIVSGETIREIAEKITAYFPDVILKRIILYGSGLWPYLVWSLQGRAIPITYIESEAK